MQLPFLFRMSSLSCMEVKHRAALVIMTPPKLIFHFHNRHGRAGSYYLECVGLSKPLHIIRISLYSSTVLVKRASVYGLSWGHGAWVTSRSLVRGAFSFFKKISLSRKTNDTRRLVCSLKWFIQIWAELQSTDTNGLNPANKKLGMHWIFSYWKS